MFLKQKINLYGLKVFPRPNKKFQLRACSEPYLLNIHFNVILRSMCILSSSAGIFVLPHAPIILPDVRVTVNS